MHYSGVTWCSWRIKLSGMRVFDQQLVRLTTKKTSKFHITDPLWEESTSDHYHSQRVSNITMTSHERHVVPNHWPFHCLCNIFCGPHQKNTEVLITGPLWGEFTGHRWIPPKKGQWRGKCFHVMTSSRKRKAFPYYNLLCYHNGIIFLAVTNNQL